METVEKIALAIKHHRESEIKAYIQNNAFGRSRVLVNDQDTTFWITNRENLGSYKVGIDITGTPKSTVAGRKSTLTNDGKPIFKNTRLGEILIKNHSGKHSYQAPIGIIECEIFNRAIFTPSSNENELATDLSIQLSGDMKIFSFRTVLEILKKVQKIDSEISELKSLSDNSKKEEAKRLLEQIENKQKEKRETLKKAQSFIRKYAQLRYQPILDPIQEDIKRSFIFKGTLIIEGGPGTGKTTSLIQRIKFLLDMGKDEVKNDYKPDLSPNQQEKLNNDNNWIFFSPNNLLALFLRNSMNTEGLVGTIDKVKVWSDYKKDIIRQYKIVNQENKRPFLFYNKGNGSLLPDNYTKLNELISLFLSHFIRIQAKKLMKLQEFDLSQFDWKNTGLSIRGYIQNRANLTSVDGIIRTFNYLEESFNTDVKRLADQYTSVIRTIASGILVSINNDQTRRQKIEDLLKSWNSDLNESTEIEEEEDEAEIEREGFGENETIDEFDFETTMFLKLKSLARKVSLIKYDRATKFSKREDNLLELIPELNGETDLRLLGQLAFFKKYFERVTKGLSFNFFREIPLVYKQFRRDQLKNQNPLWNAIILQELVKSDDNKRLHPDEQAFILYFTNNLIANIFKNFRTSYDRINHSYIIEHRKIKKTIIGVDEATDLPLIDLMAIHSLGDPEFSSVTYSGDLMQRMKTEGLKSWGDLMGAIPDTHLKSLEISYRQSHALLALAKIIHEKSANNIPVYKPFIELDQNEPRPLLYLSDDEDRQLVWLADRIQEIYKAYGDSIPSIAIFLPEEKDLQHFAKRLGNKDNLADVGIRVVPCRDGEVLGEESMVRVFAVDKIKGLEFEAVFFHNLNKLQHNNLEHDMLLKYLYVGLSRATFYLGVTMTEPFNKELSFLDGYFENNNSNWRII